MCPNKNFTSGSMAHGPQEIGSSGVAYAIRYTLPVCRETKGCRYIEFYAFDPYEGRLRRKRIKTNRVKGVVKCPSLTAKKNAPPTMGEGIVKTQRSEWR